MSEPRSLTHDFITGYVPEDANYLTKAFYRAGNIGANFVAVAVLASDLIEAHRPDKSTSIFEY